MMDETLLKMLAVYDKVMDIILPTIGPERQKTYSPFLPVCPRTGKVLQVPMIAVWTPVCWRVKRRAISGHTSFGSPAKPSSAGVIAMAARRSV